MMRIILNLYGKIIHCLPNHLMIIVSVLIESKDDEDHSQPVWLIHCLRHHHLTIIVSVLDEARDDEHYSGPIWLNCLVYPIS